MCVRGIDIDLIKTIIDRLRLNKITVIEWRSLVEETGNSNLSQVTDEYVFAQCFIVYTSS